MESKKIIVLNNFMSKFPWVSKTLYRHFESQEYTLFPANEHYKSAPAGIFFYFFLVLYLLLMPHCETPWPLLTKALSFFNNVEQNNIFEDLNSLRFLFPLGHLQYLKSQISIVA